MPVVGPTYDEMIGRALHVPPLGFTDSTSAAPVAASMRVIELAAELLAVWDGLPARDHGGAADLVRAARERGRPVEVIWPAGAGRD